MTETLSSEQFSFVDEVAADLRTYIDIVNRMEQSHVLPDAFAEWLALWSVLLGTLAWEVYTSIAILLRANKLRAAYCLSRSLYDYQIRLTYYRKQAAPIIKKWRADQNRMRHVKNGLQKIDAWRDWFTINKKMADHLKRIKPDISDMSADSLDEFRAALEASAEGDSGVRSYLEMLKVVYDDDDHFKEVSYSQWLHRSAFLHGDPITRVDVLEETVIGDNAQYTIKFGDTALKAQHIATGATVHVLDIMTEMYRITDRLYALRVLIPKADRLFPHKRPDASGWLIKEA